jgi:hypothetical protein
MHLRTTVGAAVLAAALSLPLAGVAAAQTVTCTSFTTQQAAQTVYNQNRADPNGLDRDKDGTACEPGTDGVLGNGEGAAPTTTVVRPTVVYPTRGVETGAGGTAGQPRALAESSDSGVGGIALLAGGAAALVAGGVVLVRRRVARRSV